MSSTAPADPVLAAWERERDTARRASRIVQTAVLIIAGIITAVGTGNAHDALSHHSTADPWAWMLYPGVEALLIAELQISAHLAQMEGRKSGDKREGFDWGFALRIVTGIAAVAMNVWYPVERGDISGAGLHSFGPIIQVFGIEALAQFRKRYTRIIIDRTSKITEREAKIAARNSRTQESGVPGGVPAPTPRGVPTQRATPYPTPPQASGYSPPAAAPNSLGGPVPASAGGAPGPSGNGANPETLKAQAIKLDTEHRKAAGRPASIRALKNGLGIGQDKAVELQAWLADQPTTAPTATRVAPAQP
ncbi:hypothetical protein KGQ20_39800 [Catenulispora sp. NF23]|uniref:hypothetical protein n=1 Tax=Catenulispora pinistramenti TaxID=2705254 RepID=UPI001BAA198F|nr:hypothetical protein [Catenulispora pinistramenti]MBS2538909.1 hypothetical protein [Catenulispora pinistramenti]